MVQRILLVDDDVGLLELISLRLEAAGYDVVKATSGEEALAVFHEQRPHLVVTDLQMGGMSGMMLFGHLQALAPLVPVIVLTAHGTIPEAVAATQRGVFSFLTKPFDGQELMRRVSDALRLQPSPDSTHEATTWRHELVTADTNFEELLRHAFRISSEGQATLILGAAGTGKRALAKAMHRAGEYRGGQFVSIACNDHADEELEALFLGKNGNGIVQQAQGGVLYVQDIGALPLPAQGRLASILLAQTQSRFPLQQSQSRTAPESQCQLQVICSSRRPLDAVLASGKFRSDLYYLLSTNTLRVPSLGERSGDIPLLARHILHALDPRATLTPVATEALLAANWPGNVQQLENVLAHALAISNSPTISDTTVKLVLHDSEEASLAALDDARREFERDYLVRLLKATSGNVSQAARVAQRNRSEFYKLLAKHSLDPQYFKERLK